MTNFSAKKEVSRAEVLAQFVDPVGSPVFQSLAFGCRLLHDRSCWQAAIAYHSGPLNNLYLQIWKAVLPSLSILQHRVAGLVEGWPLRLVSILQRGCQDEARVIQDLVAFGILCLAFS